MPHLVATLIYLSQNYSYHIRGDRSPLTLACCVMQLDLLLLTVGHAGYYHTGGYADGVNSWWSTGKVVPYEGQNINRNQANKYIYLHTIDTTIFDLGDCDFCYSVCETGECNLLTLTTLYYFCLNHGD